MRSLLINVVMLALVGAATVEHKTQLALNPIRKVVNLLQAMQKKVEEEGETEAKLYEKFMCYCKNGAGDLEASISAAEDKLASLPNEIKAAVEKLSQLKADVKQHQTDKQAAKDAMAEATAIREKEAAAFAKEKSYFDSTITAITKAVAALEKGVAGGFLQTSAAATLKTVVQTADMEEADRTMLTSFLSGQVGYAPQSGQIIGILKQMGDTMAADLATATATEEAAIKTYDELMASKKEEVDALTASIEKKLKEIGEVGIEVVEMKEDVDDTEKALAADKKFLAELEKGCATKTKEWEERSKTRAEELVALADTIKVLNDDDALDLFKKTLPSASASFMQTTVTSRSLQMRALEEIRKAKSVAGVGHRPGLDFLVLALSGKTAMSEQNFDKVIAMIDSMVVELKTEQKDDTDKLEYCKTELDLADDKKKGLERSVEDLEKAIAKAKEMIATLSDEIAALTQGIVDLDKSVVEATENRKEENEDYKALMAADTAAKDLLVFAKNRLNKFYNPDLYVAPPKRELSAGDRIYENFGGELTTAAPGGIANTGIAVLAQVVGHDQSSVAPPPPPATWGAYSKKSEESTGVIGMIDLLIKDLDKEMTEATAEEKDGQSDYEIMMKESAEKRVADSKSLSDKQAAKADTEKALADATAEKKDTVGELFATLKYIQSLHTECDWLMKYFEVRKTARTGEIDSLVKAKAVLSGADYSLLQMNSRGFLHRLA
jgi:septal ring factor EnvC (AmiA/AmiB activator)